MADFIARIKCKDKSGWLSSR